MYTLLYVYSTIYIEWNVYRMDYINDAGIHGGSVNTVEWIHSEVYVHTVEYTHGGVHTGGVYTRGSVYTMECTHGGVYVHTV